MDKSTSMDARANLGFEAGLGKYERKQRSWTKARARMLAQLRGRA